MFMKDLFEDAVLSIESWYKFGWIENKDSDKETSDKNPMIFLLMILLYSSIVKSSLPKVIENNRV